MCGTDEWKQRSNKIRWEGQVEEFKMYSSYKEPLGIVGEAIDLRIFVIADS